MTLRLNRPKKRNPPCAAPLCVVSSFPHGKRGERGRSARWISSLQSVYRPMANRQIVANFEKPSFWCIWNFIYSSIQHTKYRMDPIFRCSTLLRVNELMIVKCHLLKLLWAYTKQKSIVVMVHFSEIVILLSIFASRVSYCALDRSILLIFIDKEFEKVKILVLVTLLYKLYETETWTYWVSKIIPS